MQALASIDLKPALVRGEVRRLPEAPIKTETRANDVDPDRHDISHDNETEAHTDGDPTAIDYEPSSTSPSITDYKPQDEQASIGDNEPPSVKTLRSRKRRSSGAQVANGKDPWGDEEIMKLIKWKAQGMTHKEAGVSLSLPLLVVLDC